MYRKITIEFSLMPFAMAHRRSMFFTTSLHSCKSHRFWRMGQQPSANHLTRGSRRQRDFALSWSDSMPLHPVWENCDVKNNKSDSTITATQK